MEGDWEKIMLIFRDIIGRLPRAATIDDVAHVLDELTMLREEVLNRLKMRIKMNKLRANESQIERHIQNSNPESISDLEPALEKEQGAKSSQAMKLPGEPIKAFPLGMVLQACPEISNYGRGGSIGSWRELMSAAVVVRSMLGVSPSAYQDACDILGPENAAAVMACILERAGHINSAGAYLRDLTRKAERGEFSMGPMLMALMRLNGAPSREAS